MTAELFIIIILYVIGASSMYNHPNTAKETRFFALLLAILWPMVYSAESMFHLVSWLMGRMPK